MMYAASEDSLDAAKNSFFDRADDDEEDFELDPCQKYRRRVEKFLDRGDEWLLVRRQNTFTRGNNTNNYSEATMRILKDIILQRTKAFNVVALVDFCSTVLQTYFVKRLLAFAHGRRADPRLHYTEQCEKLRDVSTDSISVVDEYRYIVPSHSHKSTMYSVDAEYGLCACPSGQTGSFCKHQALVHERFNVPFPNAPAVGLEERYKLALLALGSKCSHKDFFRDFRDVGELPTTPGTTSVHSPTAQSSASTLATDVIISDVDTDALADSVKAEVLRLGGLITPYTAAAVKAFLPCLQSITSEDDLIHAMYQCRSTLRNRKGGAIKVQPTSTARRRSGVTRGCKRVAAGRPPSTIKRPFKRPRLLAANIAENVPHAKSHGVGH
jgi:hypothetical protein